MKFFVHNRLFFIILLCWGTVTMPACSTINTKLRLPFGPSEKIIVNKDKSYTVITAKGSVRISPEGKIVSKEKWKTVGSEKVGSATAVPYKNDVIVLTRKYFSTFGDNKRDGYYYKLPKKEFKKFVINSDCSTPYELVKTKNGYIFFIVETTSKKTLVYYRLNKNLQVIGKKVAIAQHILEIAVAQAGNIIYAAYTQRLPKQEGKRIKPDRAFFTVLNTKNKKVRTVLIPTETNIIHKIALYADRKTIVACVENSDRYNQHICYVYTSDTYKLKSKIKLIGKLPEDDKDNNFEAKDYTAAIFSQAAITGFKNNYIVAYNKTFAIVSVFLGSSEIRDQLETAVISSNGSLIKQNIIEPFKRSRRVKGHKIASNGSSMLVTWYTYYNRKNKYFWYMLIKEKNK